MSNFRNEIISKHVFSLVIIGGVVLTACVSNNPQPIPTVPITASVTSTKTQESPTSTQLPTQTSTNTPIPTSTPLPSDTPLPIPTFDQSTPAVPSGEWATYTYARTGLSFSYPSNWFVTLEEEHDRISLTNAPPNSVTAIKSGEGGYAPYVKIIIHLTTHNLTKFEDFETDINELINQPNWSAAILEVRKPQLLRQGYSSIYVLSSGLGERIHYFVTNQRIFIEVGMDYVPEREPVLANVIEEVVNTLYIP
jgi:hypothetical protein